MILISHRANLNGPDKKRENNPKFISKVLNKGYNCEIDVWRVGNFFYLGHDKPQYKTTETFLCNHGLWLHAKNIEALWKLRQMYLNVFWHETDTVTITNKGYLWYFPSNMVYNDGIILFPEK